MKNRIIWTRTVWELFEELPERDREEILSKLHAVQYFPQMYPVRMKWRRFRRHRWFQAGNWLVFYRVVGKIIYIRGLWPSRIP